MANKRQRLARRSFKQENGTSATDATPKATSTHKLKPSRKTISKNIKDTKNRKVHPLRTPGHKPGEGCFICKATNHVAKDCPQKLGKDKKKICLFCRKLGHTLKNCPNKEIEQEQKFCYNCGKTGHRLAECSEPLKNGGTSFAECFLCKEKGHLSKNCPTNAHGIYPKGGSCKICGGVNHLAKDCPEKGSADKKAGRSQHMKMQISKDAAPTSGENPKRIVFGSGDDLEDDFADIESDPESIKEQGKPKSKGLSGKGTTNQFGKSVNKVKSSSKVVNFKN